MSLSGSPRPARLRRRHVPARVGRDARQSVLLQIKPHVGDTLRMRLDQQTEMTGMRRHGASAAVTTDRTTTMKMFSRAIVEGSAPTRDDVRGVTDSVRLTTTDERAPGRGSRQRVKRRCAGSASLPRRARRHRRSLDSDGGRDARRRAGGVAHAGGVSEAADRGRRELDSRDAAARRRTRRSSARSAKPGCT